MSRPFIRGQIAIDSMRDNGFLSAAHALSEIIDNSVQAGADRVELIAFEEHKETKSGVKTKQISKIGIFDNGHGMDKSTLHLALEFGGSKNREDSEGIGKFGMGLPNSSISQCKHVDVWSWKSLDEINYTYLDIDEIKDGLLDLIPEPVQKEIPEPIKAVLGEALPSSGTLVLWSKIDRCQWKTGKSIHQHTQDIVGRMYRNFIENEKASIRFKSAELKDGLYIVDGDGQPFKANDPLYLAKGTSLPDLPGSYKGESLFEICYSKEFPIADEYGKEQNVKITGSYIKKSAFEALRRTTSGMVGSTIWGKHLAKNTGLSIVRAGRELSLDTSFLSSGKYKELARWYGIEISFSPALDKIFGVTNNKQHVVNLKMMSSGDDYEREGFETEASYIADLRANNDPKLRIYAVVDEIRMLEKELKERIDTLRYKGTKDTAETGLTGITQAPDSATIAADEKNKQREKKKSTASVTDDLKAVEEILTEAGSATPEESARTIVENKLQVWIEEVPMANNAFFDVSTKQGLTLLQINTNHSFATEILNKVEKEQRQALEICLAGWARMERECNSPKQLSRLQSVRKDWGQLLEDFLDPDDE